MAAHCVPSALAVFKSVGCWWIINVANLGFRCGDRCSLPDTIELFLQAPFQTGFNKRFCPDPASSPWLYRQSRNHQVFPHRTGAFPFQLSRAQGVNLSITRAGAEPITSLIATFYQRNAWFPAHIVSAFCPWIGRPRNHLILDWCAP